MKVYNEEVDFNDQNQLLEFADEAISLLTDKDASGHDMVDYLLDSRVFEAILSGFIISNKEIDPNTGISLYIPNDVLQTVDGEYVNIIDKSIIKDVVNQLPGVLDIADGFLNMDNPNYNSIDAALKNPVIDELLDNIVIEGTLVNIIGNTLSADDVKEFITMPEDYVNLDGTVNVSKWLESNELTNLINGVRRSGLVLDELVFMGELSEAQQQTVIMTQLKDNLNTEAFDDLLSSNVLHSVISGFLIDKEYSGIAIIVPNSSLYANNKLINKDEIKDILSQIPDLIPDDMEDTNGMIKQIVANKDELLKTPTLLATIVNYININLIPTLPRDLFIVPKSLEDSADTLSRDTIYGDYSGLYFINYNENNNLWINEAPALVDALDVLLGLTGDNPLDFNSSTLEDDINNKLTENISKLNDKYDDNLKNIDVVYESLIIQATLANTLDNAFTDDTIIDRGALLSLKVNDIYPKSEVSALVDAINELDLDLLGEINIASIDLFALNDASAVIQGKTKLDVVYESKIIDYIIYKQLGSNLENIMKDKDGNIRKLSDHAYE